MECSVAVAADDDGLPLSTSSGANCMQKITNCLMIEVPSSKCPRRAAIIPKGPPPAAAAAAAVYNVQPLLLGIRCSAV